MLKWFPKALTIEIMGRMVGYIDCTITISDGCKMIQENLARRISKPLPVYSEYKAVARIVGRFHACHLLRHQLHSKNIL